MSRFTRKGTVSKGSGPIHLDSYALKGVPIRYSVPIFLPELIHLPASWKQPVLPPQQSLYYDYSVERKVLEQAKNRAISIAAEASLQMKEIQRLRDANQLVESRDPDSDDSTENSSPVEPPQPKPRPPIIPGNAILTPIPVTVAASNVTGSQSSSSGDETAQTAQTVSSDLSKANTKEGESVVPLGEMSIREFEGAINNDPFEITSLQAINDMEILQTVLQPIPPPIMTSASTGTTNTSVAGPSPLAPPTNVAATGPTPSSTHQSSPTLAHGGGSSSNLQLQTVVSSSAVSTTTPPAPTPASSAVLPSGPGPAPSLPVQVPQRAGSAPMVGVASGSSPSNPFVPGGAFVAGTTVAAVSNQMVPQFQQQQQPPPPISIGAAPVSTAAPPISTNPFSAVSPPAVSATPSFPLPPSSTGVGTLIDIGQPLMPPTSTTNPPVATGGSPSITPRQNPPIPRPRTAPATHGSPAPSQTTVVAAAPVPAQRVPVVSTVPHGRPGLGVPVLPPIPNSTLGPAHQPHPHPPTTTTSGSASALPTLPPPPYKARPSPPSQHREGVAPPPYTPPTEGQRSGGQSSPRQPARSAAPLVTPRTYKLPDPSASLSAEQKSEVSSIVGMGFPSPRVARALLRCKDDKSKVFDFLFLVGRLEEQGHGGDSAETALLACSEKPEKALEYLSKVDVYRGMGFAEQRIHEAYSKSKGDWDKVLDLLVQGR